MNETTPSSGQSEGQGTGEPLTRAQKRAQKKEARKKRRKEQACLIDGDDGGNRPHLQGTEIAKPGSTGGQTR